MTLTFDPRQAMVITHIHVHANCRGQRSVGSKAGLETDGRTAMTDRITFPANAVDSCGSW